MWRLRPWVVPTMICLLVAGVSAARAQRIELDVLANVGRDCSLYFEGTVTAHKLCPRTHLQVHNEIDISVEFITADGRFATLPTTVQLTSGEAWRGNRLLTEEEKTGVGSRTVSVAGQELKLTDDGQPFAVSGAVNLEGGDRFRIIATLRHTWAGSWPAADCSYAIAGPFRVKPGVARQRKGGGLLGDVGRFLERSAGAVGQALVSNAGSLLGGALNPVSMLQQLLLGELQQRQDALGTALRYIGRAVTPETGVLTVDQILPGAGDQQVQLTGDLTGVLVQGLLQRYLGDALPGGQTGATLAQVRDVDDAIALLQGDLERRLGLRDLDVAIDNARAVVTSNAPTLSGHGHLEPVIAYMLVNAALAAPWVEDVAAVFRDVTGGTFGLRVPAAVARQYAQGGMDTATFLSMAQLTDAASLATTPAAPASTSTTPAASATYAIVAQSQLPPGWLASATETLSPAELQQVLPDVPLTAHQITWSGMQVLQVRDRSIGDRARAGSVR